MRADKELITHMHGAAENTYTYKMAWCTVFGNKYKKFQCKV